MKPWWLRLLRYAPAHSERIAALLIFMCAATALEVLKPWPLKLIVDNVLTGRPMPEGLAWVGRLPGASSTSGLLLLLSAATLVLFVTEWAIVAAQSYLQADVGSRLSYALGADVFGHLQGLSLRFHGSHPTGDLVKRLTSDCSCIKDLIVGVCLPLLGSLVTLIAMFGVMWRLDHGLALTAAAVAPGLGIAIRVFAQPMMELSYQEMELQGELMTVAERTLSALPVVLAFGGEEAEDRRFVDICRRAGLTNLKVVASELWFKLSTTSLTALGTAGVMVVGGAHVLQGKLSVGSLLVCLSYLLALYEPLETIAFLSTSYATAAAGARRIFGVLGIDDAVRDAPGAMAFPKHMEGRLKLEELSFGFEPGRLVLHGVNLEVHPGEALALVGQTGAGKSTLVSLILRFFDPWGGKIMIDGFDIRTMQLTSLRANVAVVLQEPFLMPLTIAENIAYGRPGASLEEIRGAAVAANADEFVRKLPNGYDSVLDERGANISGGQKQRLAIARAFLKDAPVLILDEPTSALDTENEALLVDALERLRKNRTTIIIAHKLSTIRKADRVAVMQEGEIIEIGKHEELLAANGQYRRLYDLQFSAPTAGGESPG
jgi:ATP-binding cassette subfamily B protein